MKKGLLLLLMICGLLACNHNKAKNDKKLASDSLAYNTGENSKSAIKDTITYKYVELKKRAPDCGSKVDSDCTVAHFKYPVFDGQRSLNDTVTCHLINLFQLSEKPLGSIGALTDHFISNYMADKKDNGQGMFYSLDCYAYVLRQDSSLTVVEVDGHAYAGGAHGGYQTIFINWNTRQNKPIEIPDIISTANLPKFTKIAEGIFRKDEKLTDTASLEDNYFFDGGNFSLANTFRLAPKGIMFLYNEYEIKSYAEGITELFVPYDKIKTLLRPNTVVTQYLK